MIAVFPFVLEIGLQNTLSSFLRAEALAKEHSNVLFLSDATVLFWA